MSSHLIPNIGTILVVALMLFAYRVWAAPVENTLPPSEPAASSAVLAAVPAASATPGMISYQGTLTNAVGEPVSGNVDITFRLYASPTGGTALWTEARTSSNAVLVSSGLFNVLLGSLTPIPASVWNNADIYLGVQIAGDIEMSPREIVGAVPIAISVPDGSITAEKLSLDAATIGTTYDQGGNDYGSLQFNYSSGHIKIRSASSGITGGHALAIDLQNDDRSLLEIVRQMVGPVAYIKANGDFVAYGTKSAVVQTENYGLRRLYAVEAPDVRFSDEGLALLHDGTAQIDLDPIFLETIEGDYLIQITPYGNASLYVSEIASDHFVVRVRDGNPSVAFAWHLSAHRKGYAETRLERTETP